MGDIVEKPWGTYQVTHTGKDFLIKRLTIEVNHRISLQKHSKRSEYWTVDKGEATVEIGGNKRVLHAGCSASVEKGEVHRITNTGYEPLIMTELQMGECSEEDIERKEDDYGRV
jgi:mannose-6-phosphate isomerase-like protein (cupin superfamily)